MNMAAWRRVVEEYEAELFKVPMPRIFRNEMGELERKTYADGEELLEIVFRGAKVPDGSTVAVVIEGKHVCAIEVRRGRVRLDLSSLRGSEIPRVSHGDVAEIQFGGQALLRGTFKPD
jgi:hypothetical protein